MSPCPDCAHLHFKAPLDWPCHCSCHAPHACVDCADTHGDQALEPIEVDNNRLAVRVRHLEARLLTAKEDAEAFRKLGALEERQECVKAVLNEIRFFPPWDSSVAALKKAAAAIRARGLK